MAYLYYRQIPLPEQDAAFWKVHLGGWDERAITLRVKKCQDGLKDGLLQIELALCASWGWKLFVSRC